MGRCGNREGKAKHQPDGFQYLAVGRFGARKTEIRHFGDARFGDKAIGGLPRSNETGSNASDSASDTAIASKLNINVINSL